MKVEDIISYLNNHNCHVAIFRHSESYASHEPWSVSIEKQVEGMKVEATVRGSDLIAVLSEAWRKLDRIISGHPPRGLSAPLLEGPKSEADDELDEEIPF